MTFSNYHQNAKCGFTRKGHIQPGQEKKFFFSLTKHSHSYVNAIFGVFVSSGNKSPLSTRKVLKLGFLNFDVR